MSLTTYAQLKDELEKWTNRPDLTSATAGGVDTYIDLFESWFNRNMRVRQMVTVATPLTISASGEITHPTGWVAWKQITLTSTTPVRKLPATSEDALLTMDNSNAAGMPRRHVVRGSVTQVWPVPDGVYTYQGIYFKSVVPLDGTNTSNWLLTAYPDAYLFGSLAVGYAYIQQDDRAAMWAQQFARVVGEIRTQSGADEYSTPVDSPTLSFVV